MESNRKTGIEKRSRTKKTARRGKRRAGACGTRRKGGNSVSTQETAARHPDRRHVEGGSHAEDHGVEESPDPTGVNREARSGDAVHPLVAKFVKTRIGWTERRGVKTSTSGPGSLARIETLTNFTTDQAYSPSSPRSLRSIAAMSRQPRTATIAVMEPYHSTQAQTRRCQKVLMPGRRRRAVSTGIPRPSRWRRRRRRRCRPCPCRSRRRVRRWH